MNKINLSPPLLLLMLVVLIMGIVAQPLQAQQSQMVTGVVIDQQGVTLPGVSVVVKGTSQGTITDLNGQFSVPVNSSSDVLVFSFIGFITYEKSASAKQPFRITLMEDVQSLDEVVVVGYGTQSKETVTGAISTLQSKELVEVPTSNLSTAITGKMAGVVTVQSSGRPGEDAAKIYIRGRSTWVNSNPLIVVDGVERESFSQIDPNEVESISVLKDASATAVYGVRGANGVILVTTKRGQEGRPQISITANLGVQRPVNIPEFLGSYDHLMLRKVATINDGKDPANDPYLSDEALEGYRLGEDPYLYPDVNWYKEVVKPFALQQKYNFNVAGGTKKVKYFVSLGFLNQGGMFKYTDTHDRYSSDTDYQRFNFRSNLDISINKYQTLSANISGRTQTQSGFPDVANVMQSLIAKVPYVFPMFNPDGSYAAVAGQGNPLVKISNSGYDESHINNYDIVGILKNDLSFITPGLALDMNLSFNSSMGTVKRYREQPDVFEYNASTGEYDQLIEATPFTYNGESEISSSVYRRLGIQMQLKYGKKIGKHKMSGMLVYNQLNEQNRYYQPHVLMGYSGRLEYDYDSKYLAEVNVGYNGSENFAPGHQFGLFPALSLGYVISQEKFMESLSSVVKFMKLRGSVGLVGNDNIGGARFLWQGMYSYVGTDRANLQYFGFGTTNPTSLGGLYESRSENVNLTWETALKQNIGLDLRLFKDNLFAMSVDVFKEHRKDILMAARSLLSTTGIPSPQYNIGEVKNWGYEFDITHRNQLGQIGYAIQANYGFSRNEIINYDDPAGTPNYQKYAGYQIGQFRGYEVLGFFQSEEEILNSPDQSTLGGPIIPGDLKYRDVNKDGQISDLDRVPIGYSSVPEIVYSVTPEVSWKGITFSAMFQGAANSSVFFTSNAGFEFGGAAGGGQVTTVHQDYWTEDNTDAAYPALHLNPQHSNKNLNSFHLKSGNYLRLRNVQLSYALPPQLCRRLNLSGVSFSLTGNNLKTWSKIDNFDPETVKQNGEVYPQQSVYSIGVNIKL